MKKMSQQLTPIFISLIVLVFLSVNYSPTAFAGIEWDIQKTLTLDDTPLDVAYSLYGAKAYVLCKKNLLIYDLESGKVTDKIPLETEFSKIAVTPNQDLVYLTDVQGKKISVLSISNVYTIDIGQSPIIGPKDAKVNIVAFLDFQCPYCGQIYPTLQEVLKKYPKEVNLIIKHYPLTSIHKAAENAAVASLAAARQKKYKELNDILFKNYRNINDDSIKTYAKEAGLDMTAFDKDVKDPELKKIIADDMKQGQKLGVRGVPSIYINGKPLKGRSIDVFTKTIDKELKK
jgi:protein-disulfide isomerase